MPADSILANCYYSNPDGCGYMVADGETVNIRKGFMTLDSFLDDMRAQGDLTGRGVVMHFRIATHGEVKPACCHPFPVSNDLRELSATEFASRVAVAHNGIIPGMDTSDDVSDTMCYVYSILAPLRGMHEDFMHDQNALDLIENTVKSKLCFLDNSGEIVTVGEFVEDGGVLYSNTSYLRTLYSWGSKRDFWESAPLPGYEDSDLTGSLCDAMDNGEIEYSDASAAPFNACWECDNAMDCLESGGWLCGSEAEAMETSDEFYYASLGYSEKLAV